MKFQYLEDVHKEWRDILVIGKTIERDGRRYHIVGMTMDEMAKLYIIEPYNEPEHQEKKEKRDPQSEKANEGTQRGTDRQGQLSSL